MANWCLEIFLKQLATYQELKIISNIKFIGTFACFAYIPLSNYDFEVLLYVSFSGNRTLFVCIQLHRLNVAKSVT